MAVSAPPADLIAAEALAPDTLVPTGGTLADDETLGQLLSAHEHGW